MFLRDDYIDETNGHFRPGVNLTQFYEEYNKAISDLEELPSYSHYRRMPVSGYPFPNIAKLFNN